MTKNKKTEQAEQIEQTEQVEQADQTEPAEQKELSSEPVMYEAVGVSVKLHHTHPQDSYGRAGFRFNKTEAINISLDELSDEQIHELDADPWLEVIFITGE